MFGGGRQRGQQREGLERGGRVAAPQGFERHVQHGHMVGHEEGVELAFLEFAGELAQLWEIEIHIGPGPGISPRARVDRRRAHECAEMQSLVAGHDRLPSAQTATGLVRRKIPVQGPPDALLADQVFGKGPSI